LVEIAFVEPNGAKSRSRVVGADTGLYDRFVLQATTGIDPKRSHSKFFLYDRYGERDTQRSPESGSAPLPIAVSGSFLSKNSEKLI
jgi:hypothetical protein